MQNHEKLLPPCVQGLVVTFMATRMGWTPDDSEALLNWLICVEMVFAAVGGIWAVMRFRFESKWVLTEC